MTGADFQANLRVRAANVLVLGGGAAGIRAALTAARAGAKTVLLSDQPVGRSGSTFYPQSPEWGVLFAEDENDARRFEGEILASAGPCVNPAFAHMLADRSQRCFEQMRREGLRFRLHRDMNLIGCFGSTPRGAVLVGMENAAECWRRLLAQTPNLETVGGYRAADLVVKDGRAAGAFAVAESGEMLFIAADAVVLALGGAEGLYQYAFNNGELTGTAYAMAGRQGARMANLEFIQFINGALAPVYGLNYYQFAFREQPTVRDVSGAEFLRRYLPPGVTPEEVLNARARHGPFCMDDVSGLFDLAIVRHGARAEGIGAVVAPDAARLGGVRYAHWRAFLNRMGMTVATEMTIYPFCHCFNGGVLVKPSMQTDIPGLYACGESAGGCHGANRMGGNAVMGTQVFGMAAGESAADERGNAPRVTAKDVWDGLHASFDGGAGETGDIETVRALMQRHCFLERDERGLNAALDGLNAVNARPMNYLGTPRAAERFAAANARDAAIWIARSMLGRRETRGGHFRTDFPQQRAAYAKMLYVAGKDKAQ